MKSIELFVGYPLNPTVLFQLGQLPEEERALFVGRNEGQLETIYFHNEPFIGKQLGRETTLEKLVLVESHIYSVLKKWLPKIPHEETKLMVLSLG